MTGCMLVKTEGGKLKPAYTSDYEFISKIKNGTVVYAEIKQPRNPLYHKRFFAMLNFAFDYWEPHDIEIEGENGRISMKPVKSFERFRKDVLILAGYRTMVTNIKNEVRYEAQSISFASMDETKFHEVYKSVFRVLWKLVLSKVEGMTEKDAENSIAALLSYE